MLSEVYIYIVRFLFSFLFNRSQLKASVVNQICHLFFCSFQLFENGHIHNVVLILINVVKLDFGNSNIALTLPNVVNINVEIDNVDSTWFNVVNFNLDIHSVVSTLIWHCLKSQCPIILTTTLRQLWNIC